VASAVRRSREFAPLVLKCGESIRRAVAACNLERNARNSSALDLSGRPLTVELHDLIVELAHDLSYRDDEVRDPVPHSCPKRPRTRSRSHAAKSRSVTLEPAWLSAIVVLRRRASPPSVWPPEPKVVGSIPTGRIAGKHDFPGVSRLLPAGYARGSVTS
jgi:hypothetical protein